VLAIANLAQIIGEVGFGKLSDKVPFQGLCVLASSLVAAIATLTLWGLSHTLIQLIFFGIVFGAFASGFISLWARIGT
jgi:MFS family permease